MRRLPLLRAIIVLAVLAGALALFILPTRAQVRAPALAALQLDWPADTRFDYRLDWVTNDAVNLFAAAGAPLTSELELEGELSLRSYGLREGSFLLGLSLAPTHQHITALGQSLGEDTSLGGREALLSISTSGEVEKLVFAQGEPEIFKSLVQALAAEISMSLPPTPVAEWSAEADDNLGHARFHYAQLTASLIERQRTGYSSLRALPGPEQPGDQTSIDSKHRIAFDTGHIETLDEVEQLSVKRSGVEAIEHRASLALHLIRSARVQPAAPAIDASSGDARKPGRPVMDQETARRLMEKRTGGMSENELLGQLYSHLGGGLHDNHEFFAHAVALLILHPELCSQLVPVFLDRDASGQTRRVVLDLLTGAGHPQAQAAMRTCLSSDAARSDPQFGLMLQRFSLVGNPAPETLAYLEQTRAQAAKTGDAEVARASEYSLGAAVGWTASHDPAAAARYNQILAGALGKARDPAERAALIESLGNAGLTENLPLLLSSAGDEDASVRAATASALRKTDTPEANAALFQLAADGDSSVGYQALSSLRARSLDDDSLGRLESLLLAGRLDPENQPLLATLLQERLAQSPAALRILRELLAATPDVQLKARLYTLLGQPDGT